MDNIYLLRVVLPAVVVVVIGFVIERILAATISRFGRRKSLTPSAVHLLRLIARWGLAIIVTIVVVGIFGISVANLWISIAAFVTAALIGFFAVWSVLSNILATFVVLAWRPFQIGDKVTILPEDITGTTTDINLFYAKIETEEGDIINIPSNMFVTRFIKVYPKK